MNDEITQTQEIDTESPEELEKKRERRKGIRSFFEFQIMVSVIATAVLTVFTVFPLPKEMLDRTLTLLFVMELIAFFPVINILGLLMTICGLNRKSNSDLMIRFLLNLGSFTLMANMVIMFLLRNLG